MKIIKNKYKIIPNKKIGHQKIEDKYLWVSNKKKAKKYIDIENKKTQKYFNQNNNELIQIEKYNTDLYSNDFFEIEYKIKENFVKERYGSFLKKIIYLKPKGKKYYKIILDLNDKKYKDFKFLEMNDYCITSDLKYFIYLIDEKGDERFKLYVNRIEDNLEITNLVILKDINSFSIVSEYDLLFVSKAKNKILKESDISRRILAYDINGMKKLFSKKIVTTPKIENEENLKLIYLEKNSILSCDVYLSKDKEVIFIESGDHSSNQIKYIKVKDFIEGKDFKNLIGFKTSIINSIGKRNNDFYVLNNLDSDNKYIYLINNHDDIKDDNPKINRKIVYKPKEGRFISDFHCFKDFMLVCEKYSCKSYLYVIENYNFKNKKELKFFNKYNNYHISILTQYCPYDSKELLYSISSIGSTLKLYSYNISNGNNHLLFKKRLRGLHEEEYIGKNIIASLKDNEYINTPKNKVDLPISYYYNKNFYKKKSDFKNCPIYITGYGAYGYELTNSFTKMYPYLLKNGFIIVSLHIRGGGENGMSWYKAGKMLNKINCILDFQNGIKYVSDYFNSKRIAVRTRSAGGIIIGNALNNLDGIIKVAIPEVPFVDCLTTLANKNLPLTKLEFTEFGDPSENEESFNNIMKISPYENIRKKYYPHIYIIGGLNDYRVRYDEPTKYYFKLLEHNLSKKSNILLDINNYGHFGPSEPNEDITFISKIQLFILKNI